MIIDLPPALRAATLLRRQEPRDKPLGHNGVDDPVTAIEQMPHLLPASLADHGRRDHVPGAVASRVTVKQQLALRVHGVDDPVPR
jgi:hypothetical protein